MISEISDGGAETLVKDYVLHLDHNIFDVYVVTDMESDAQSANYRTLYEKGTKIYCPFINSGKGRLYSILVQIQNRILRHVPQKFINIYQKWYIKHLIQRIKPDVIHSHLKVLKYLVPCAKFLNETKLFYTCHSIPCRYFNKKECKEEFDAATFLIKNFSLTLIGLHREMQNELNTLFNINNSIVVHNGIDLDRFYEIQKNKERKQIRMNLGIQQKAFVLGHVGRFIWIKNQSFIVDVFYELLKKKENAFLLLVGNGDSSEISRKLEQKGLKEKYLILSNRQDVPEILLCMDVFLFPSFFEGFPLACIEAQAIGLKCCISDTINKDVFLGHNAIPISLSDPAEQWAQKILDNKIQGPYIGDIEEFDIKTITKNLSTLYR
ncbi:glycosyltransferase [Fibrobacter sp. UWCM]|uniref:glycosyltransferase n=1 Tax=Fibrobacter sp. UWCM TaxID=1896208 RepID=UPI0015872A37|nr:glycosyltransferase [Fibrobacter sp. UWCM]